MVALAALLLLEYAADPSVVALSRGEQLAVGTVVLLMLALLLATAFIIHRLLHIDRAARSLMSSAGKLETRTERIEKKLAGGDGRMPGG
jgi:hypothetical protein